MKAYLKLALLPLLIGPVQVGAESQETDLLNRRVVVDGVDRDCQVEEPRKMSKGLKALGADFNYSELPGVGHNAWDPAYANEELIT